ncbi:MAG: hypothetical protein V1829_01235 [bacterium]
MLIKSKEITNSRVITQSNNYLGRVVYFEIDDISQKIVKYYVSDGFLDFWKDSLIINASQVVKIKKGEIIVEDSVVLKKEAKRPIEYAK